MPMPNDPSPQSLLLAARIVPGGYCRLKSLADRRRSLAALAGLRGTLLFDGERIAELLLAPAATLDAAWTDLCSDPGFEPPQALSRDPSAGAEALRGWRYGYCEAADLDPVFGIGGETRAIEALLRVARRVDLSP